MKEARQTDREKAINAACAIVQAADCPTDLIERIYTAILSERQRAQGLVEALDHIGANMMPTGVVRDCCKRAPALSLHLQRVAAAALAEWRKG